MLPAIEKWEAFMLLNCSTFPAIEEELLLVGTRVLPALENVSSYYLKSEFRKNSHHFLKEFVGNILSTVAACFLISQGLCCFCPPIMIGRMTTPRFTYSGSFLLGFGEGLDQEIYGATVQGRISFHRGRAQAARTAFNEEAF